MRQNQNSRAHAVTACIGLGRHGAMHALAIGITGWYMHLLHGI